jgi:DNA-directed RNA polymerase subunit RPC12/RpoP
MTTEDLINGLKHTADDHPCCRGTMEAATATIKGLERENARLTHALKEKIIEANTMPCPHCGSYKDTWFSRTEPMGYYCSDCGKMVD